MPKGIGYGRHPGKDALLLAALTMVSDEDRKRILRRLREIYGTKATKGLDPKGNPEDLSPQKAKKILRDGSVRGHRLTPKQRRYMGAVAGGNARK